MSLLRQSGPYVVSAVAGLATGAGLYILYFRLSREIADIKVLLEELKEEIETTAIRRRRNIKAKPACSLNASSGDDDDDFEDALAGLGDDDIPERNASGRSMMGRSASVQFVLPVSSQTSQPDRSDSVDIQSYKQIDDLITAGSKTDYEQAFSLLRQMEKKLQVKQDGDFHWRFSKVSYFIANSAGEQGDAEKKKKTMYQAKGHAATAVILKPDSPDAHKWLAITIGCIGDYAPTAEKIKNAIVIKKHIQIAIDLNPLDPTPHHMLGRWCYSVYMLTWLERKAAAAFFGSPPTASVENALSHFEEAEKLNPDKWKENMLYIGKCLVEMRKNDEAVKWLRKAKAGADETDVDAEVQAEVRALLARYDR